MSVGSIYLYEIVGMKLQNLFIWFYFMTPGLDYKKKIIRYLLLDFCICHSLPKIFVTSTWHGG